MEFCVLASGSNGNAIYVGSRSSGAGVLLDSGISRRQIKLRLSEKGKDPDNLAGVFITHEHRDHICGLNILSKFHQVPVYLTEGTWQGIRKRDHIENINFIHAEQTLWLNDMAVEVIPKSHDAGEPVAFTITINGSRWFYGTDFGAPNQQVYEQIHLADAIILETNYDAQMLQDGPYPPMLKARIRSSHGHMSNLKAANLVRQYARKSLQYLILAHLSENNNHPALVERQIAATLSERPDLNPKVGVASRYAAGELFQLESPDAP